MASAAGTEASRRLMSIGAAYRVQSVHLMRNQTFVRRCLVFVLLLAVTACGGGRSSSSTPLGPSSEPPPVIYDAGASGVNLPTVVREVKPLYPAAALARRIQGSVLVGGIVQVDGTLTDVTVIRSIDAVYGLRRRGRHRGQAVAVHRCDEGRQGCRPENHH